MEGLFKQQQNTLQAYYSKKKGAHNSKFLAKIIGIPDSMKQRILQMYMLRMKFFFTLKTLKWFLMHRSENYTSEQMSDLAGDIHTRSKQLYEVDCLLFGGVDLPVLLPKNIVMSQKA